MEPRETPSGQAWKRFVRRHWKITLLAAAGIAAVAIAALLVFLWVVASAQASGLVPSALGAWTAGYALSFLLNVILWELLLVATWGIPIGVAAYVLWYRRLPQEERTEIEGGPRRGRSAGRNGGFSFFVGLVWLIIVWLSGRWNLPFELWTVNDFVISWIQAGLVVLAIVGIPGTIYILWVLMKKD